MPGQRPYYEFEHDGEHKTIEADTWKMDGADIVFGKWVFEGPERRKIMEAMQQDYMDFAMLGDATGSIEDGWLVLRVDLRPPGTRTENGEAATG